MPSLVTEVALAVEEAASIEVAHCITCSTDPYPWVVLSLGWCSDNNRVVHINSKLHAIFCGIFITLVAVIVPMLFRYSHNRVRGAHLRPRGRCHNITITSGSVLSKHALLLLDYVHLTRPIHLIILRSCHYTR
jgi:hypothetical protein